MTCVKTGARIYFQDYGMMVVGDAYFIGDCFIFRWNVNSKDYNSSAENATYVIDRTVAVSSYWHRDDLGVTVAPAYLVAALAER